MLLSSLNQLNQGKCLRRRDPFIILVRTHSTWKRFFFLSTLSLSLHNFLLPSLLNVPDKWTKRRHCVLEYLDPWPCDLGSNRRRNSVNSTSISDFIYMPHIIWIHYSYNQLANHLLRKHHLGNGYFYIAHLDALFLFTSSSAEIGNNNNAQRVIVDVHITSANKIAAMPQNPIWHRVKHWKPVQSNQGVESWKQSCLYLLNVQALLLKSW